MVQPPSDFIDLGPTWELICELWGHVSTIRDNERIQQQLAEHVISHKVETRYDPRVPRDYETMRLVDVTDGDRKYNISGWINEDELNQRLQFLCLEARE